MTQPASLKKGIGLWGVVSLGLGTAIGVSIFSAMGPATQVAGPAMLTSVLIAALPMYLIAVSYAYLGAAMPVSGASFVWPARFLHPLLGFVVAWMRILGSTGAIVVLSLVLVQYLAMVVPLPTKPAMLAILFAALFANLAGVRFAARFQIAMIIGLVALFAVFAIWGAGSVRSESFVPFAPAGLSGILAAMPILMGLFFGLEAATETGAEVADSKRSIPFGIAIAIGSATLLYLVIGAVALGVLGPTSLGASEAPILEAAEVFMGPLAKPVIVIAAVVAIGTSLNAIFAIFSRSLLAMAQEGMLPSVLARIHPHRGVPHIALFTVFLVGCAGLLLPLELTFLFLAVNIPTILKYACICLVMTKVARDHPEIHARSGLLRGRRAAMGVGIAGATSALILAAAGFQADWRPYALLAIWTSCGLAVYFAGRARHS